MAKLKGFIDCFVLMNTAFSLSGGKPTCEMSTPQIQEVESVVVNVSVSIEDMYFINLQQMEIETVLLVHQRWVDLRLGANTKTKNMAVMGDIWRPRISFLNGKTLYAENKEDSVFWRGFTSEGNILLSEKLMLRTFCTSNLKYFPFDQLICQFKFGSYQFPTEELELYWSFNPVEPLKSFNNIKEFAFVKVNTTTSVECRPSGNFSVLVIKITFQRFAVYYILCITLSSTLIISLNYVTICLEKEHRKLKYLINSNCLIILLIIYVSSTCGLQTTDYLKAIDLYCLLNVAFGIFGLFEIFLVDFFCSIEILRRKDRWLLKFILWVERSFKIGYMFIYVSCVIMLYLFLM